MWEPAQYKNCAERVPVQAKTVCADLSEPVASGEVFDFIQGNVDKAWHSFSACACLFIFK